MHECNETRCYGWQDKRKMQNMWKTMHARGSRSIERCRDAIEPTSMDREAIEDPKTFSIDPPSCWESVEIAIRNSLRTWQIARCRGFVKVAINSFSRREKHKHECNQACNSTNDPINILSSQNHLSTTILSTKIPNTHTHTHTHTLNKSNQFYISKTSQDSLVSIH